RPREQLGSLSSIRTKPSIAFALVRTSAFGALRIGAIRQDFHEPGARLLNRVRSKDRDLTLNSRLVLLHDVPKGIALNRHLLSRRDFLTKLQEQLDKAAARRTNHLHIVADEGVAVLRGATLLARCDAIVRENIANALDAGGDLRRIEAAGAADLDGYSRDARLDECGLEGTRQAGIVLDLGDRKQFGELPNLRLAKIRKDEKREIRPCRSRMELEHDLDVIFEQAIPDQPCLSFRNIADFAAGPDPVQVNETAAEPGSRPLALNELHGRPADVEDGDDDA